MTGTRFLIVGGLAESASSALRQLGYRLRSRWCFAEHFGWLVLAILVPLPFLAHGQSSIHVEPPAIGFGGVPIGQTAFQDLVISNSGPDNLTVNSIMADPALFAWQGPALPYLIPPGGTQPIQASFTPTDPGPTNGTLFIQILTLVNPITIVPLSGEGTGSAPLVLSNLNLLDPAITEAIIAAQIVGEIAGALFTNSNGEAIGGDVVFSPATLFSNLAGFNIPSNVLVVAQNWDISDPLSVLSQFPPPVLNGTLQLDGGLLNLQLPALVGKGTIEVIGPAPGTVLELTATDALSADKLIVSNIGSSGLDGVRVDINAGGEVSIVRIEVNTNTFVTITNTFGSVIVSNINVPADGVAVIVDAADSFIHRGNSVFSSNSTLQVFAPTVTNTGTILSTGGVLEFTLTNLFNSGHIGGEDPTFTSFVGLSIDGGGTMIPGLANFFLLGASGDIEVGSQTIGGDTTFKSTGGGNVILLEGAEVIFPKGIITIESPLINDGAQLVVQKPCQLRCLQGFTQNNGQIHLDDGILDAPLGLNLSGGSLVGSGTITGNVFNAGILAPGNPDIAGSTGILDIQGSYEILPGGIIELDVNGATPGTEHDQVAAVSITEPGSLSGPRIAANVFLAGCDVIGCADRVIGLRSENAFPAGTTLLLNTGQQVPVLCAPLPELTPDAIGFRILRINGFSPTTGSPGTSVLFEDMWPCEGDFDFNDAVVRFNGIQSPLVIAESATSLRAIVPAGATSGPVTITMSGATVTTSNIFTVLPDRPEISKVELQSDGRIRFSIAGTAGLEIILEATENFLQWTRISTNQIPPGGVVIVDTPAADSRIFTNRFYRGLFDRQAFPP